jgi:hypothetical protein
MAHYLVSAVPKQELMEKLGQRLAKFEFEPLRPFGRALSHSLREARMRRAGVAVWEDYCRPPLAQDCEAVLDTYFEDLRVELVSEGACWQKIERLPRLFPEFEL